MFHTREQESNKKNNNYSIKYSKENKTQKCYGNIERILQIENKVFLVVEKFDQINQLNKYKLYNIKVNLIMERINNIFVLTVRSNHFDLIEPAHILKKCILYQPGEYEDQFYFTEIVDI